jgi:hypothetical protein
MQLKECDLRIDYAQFSAIGQGGRGVDDGIQRRDVTIVCSGAAALSGLKSESAT